jgi:hypothetical protein
MLVRYYIYAPDGLFVTEVQLPDTAPAPAFSTLDAPAGASPGQVYRRVGLQWIIEDPSSE